MRWWTHGRHCAGRASWHWLPALIAASFIACAGPQPQLARDWTVRFDHSAGAAGTILLDRAIFGLDERVDEGARLASYDLRTGTPLWTVSLRDVPVVGTALDLFGHDDTVIVVGVDGLAWFDTRSGAILGMTEGMPCDSPTHVAASSRRATIRCSDTAIWTSSGDVWSRFPLPDGETFSVVAAADRTWVLDSSSDGTNVALRVWRVDGEPGVDPAWTHSLFDPMWTLAVDDGVVYGRVGGYMVVARRVVDGRLVHDTTIEPPMGEHLGGWHVATVAHSGMVLRMHRVTAWESGHAEPSWTIWLPMTYIDELVEAHDGHGVIAVGPSVATLVHRETGAVVWTIALPETDDECTVMGGSRAGLIRRCTTIESSEVHIESLAPSR